MTDLGYDIHALAKAGLFGRAGSGGRQLDDKVRVAEYCDPVGRSRDIGMWDHNHPKHTAMNFELGGLYLNCESIGFVWFSLYHRYLKHLDLTFTLFLFAAALSFFPLLFLEGGGKWSRGLVPFRWPRPAGQWRV